MGIVSIEDMDYLAQQSSGKINMILSGMTALMNDTDNKIAVMESQGWFQRMVKTVTGKNRLTQDEIQRNHDKMNSYMTEAIAELYNRNRIDQEVIMSLGTQMNELYSGHVQLKQMLGAFVQKLNEKIDSVDNFHMLTEEITLGTYNDMPSLVAVCKIISQFDERMLENDRKLTIVKKSLQAQRILTDEQIALTDYLGQIVDIPMEDIGQIYLEIGTIRGNYLADIIIEMIEGYHFLPDMARKLKSKTGIIDEIVNVNGLSSSVTLSISDIYEEFINSKLDIAGRYKAIQIEMNSMDVKSTESGWQNVYINLDNENYNEVIEICKSEGDKNADAQIVLAYCYALGLGVAENDAKAVELLQKALGKECELNILCRNMLSFYYLTGGNGVKQNPNFTLEILRKGGSECEELRSQIRKLIDQRENLEWMLSYGMIQAEEAQRDMEQLDFKIMFKDWKAWAREWMQAYLDSL